MFFSDFLGFLTFCCTKLILPEPFFPVLVETNDKMDFTLNTAEIEDDDFKLVFSDDEVEGMESNDSTAAEDEIFFDESDQEEEEDRSFHRNFDNREEYPWFTNQTKNPVEVVKEPEVEYFGEDDLPELFDPENWEEVNFDAFGGDYDRATNFKKSLLCFPKVENHFFYAVIYGLMHDKLNGQDVKLENAKETLGKKLFY